MRSTSLRAAVLISSLALLGAGLTACEGDAPCSVMRAVGCSPARPSTTPVDQGFLAADGIGPYRVGMQLATLQGQRRVVGEITTPECAGWVTAAGVGAHSAVTLVFYDGLLKWVDVDTPVHATASGAKVGGSLADAKAMYPNAQLLPGPAGEQALSVVSGKNTLLLRFDKEQKLQLIEAGATENLVFRYTDGEGC